MLGTSVYRNPSYPNIKWLKNLNEIIWIYLLYYYIIIIDLYIDRLVYIYSLYREGSDPWRFYIQPPIVTISAEVDPTLREYISPPGWNKNRLVFPSKVIINLPTRTNKVCDGGPKRVIWNEFFCYLNMVRGKIDMWINLIYS